MRIDGFDGGLVEDMGSAEITQIGHLGAEVDEYL
jgi:hypothetical protein